MIINDRICSGTVSYTHLGGFGKLNKGKCYECSRNPNINTEVNVSEEKARQKQRYDPNI